MSLTNLRSRQKRRLDPHPPTSEADTDKEPTPKRKKRSPMVESPIERQPETQETQKHPTSNQPPSPPSPPSPPTPHPTLKLSHTTGDIFAPSTHTLLLLHACNCEGSWGAGIAAAFKRRFPAAFDAYARHCARAKSRGERLVGSALLIPPPRIPPSSPSGRGRAGEGGEGGAFVGCLFTSQSKGKKRDPKGQILDATAGAVRAVMREVRGWNSREEGEGGIREVRMCKINSGLFGVPWEETRAVLEGLEAEGFAEVEVVSLPGR